MGLEMFAVQSRVLSKIQGTAQVEETNVRLAVGFLAMFVYLFIGAVVFCRIEAPLEKIEHETYAEFREHWTRILTSKGITEKQIDSLFANIRDAALKGIWTEKNVTAEPNWTFGQAFFFAGTLLTTVGYGHISAQSAHGKLFTIVYCIVGIPFCLALLSAFAVRLRWPSAWLRAKISTKLGGYFHGKHLQLIHLGAVSMFVLIFAFVIPSWIFIAIEDDWTFIDAFYYCFISLSTIGLGDYVPGDKPSQPLRTVYKFIVTVYLLLGLCCMMLFLTTLYDCPQFNLTRYFVTKSDEETTEGKPIHMHNGGPKYGRYGGDADDSPGNTSIPEFGTNGQFYQ
ncbi:Two pore potassium channel protein sup-9 [Aphelenchoides bicaudatus]|nr:Two pore potassium channel protein sup-9 [Aphelenchoides bicaudatus]